MYISLVIIIEDCELINRTSKKPCPASCALGPFVTALQPLLRSSMSLNSTILLGIESMFTNPQTNAHSNSTRQRTLLTVILLPDHYPSVRARTKRTLTDAAFFQNVYSTYSSACTDNVIRLAISPKPARNTLGKGLYIRRPMPRHYH